MRAVLDASRFKALARRTAAVVKARGAAHPSLELVVFDFTEYPSKALAANAGAIYVGQLDTIDLDTVPEDARRWAIRQEHLTAIAGLAPGSSRIELDADRATVTFRITAGETTIGSWTIPVAGRRELDAFPDEPEMLAAVTQGLSFDATELIAALEAVAPFATDSGTIQITRGQLCSATWAGAAAAAIETGPMEGMVALPGQAATILSRMSTGKADRVRVSETEGWYHLVQHPHHRLHLAKLTSAVDAIEPTYFGTERRASFDIHVTGSALARAVERASALTDHVRLTLDDRTLEVAAADGTSTQRVDAGFIGPDAAEADGWVFPTATLLPVLRLLDQPVTVALNLPAAPAGLGHITHGSKVYALVPVGAPDE